MSINDSKWKKVGQGDFYKWETPGQTVEGIYRGQKAGNFGQLGTVDREDGSRITFPLHTALLDKMDQIQPGAEVLIKYTGKEKNKKGQDFKAFEVFVSDLSQVEVSRVTPKSFGNAPVPDEIPERTEPQDEEVPF